MDLGTLMAKYYCLLKGRVNYLTVFEKTKTKVEQHSGDLTKAFIDEYGGLIRAIFLLFYTIIRDMVVIFIPSKTLQRKLIKGTYFYCYVGNIKVEGRLEDIIFKNGDYVEMVVEQTEKNKYFVYAVRMPKYHALFFPKGNCSSTLELFKGCLLICCLLIFPYIIFMIIAIFDDGSDFIFITLLFLVIYASFVVICFILFGMRSSFINNRIYATLGYRNSWRHMHANEDYAFREMNRKKDPLLFDDPQSPEFKKRIKPNKSYTYYGRTPQLPQEVDIIDES